MIDLALLRIVKYQEQYNKVSRYIPRSAIDKRTKAIVADIGKYFEANPEETELDFASFRSMFFTTWHKNLSKDDCDFYNKLISRMEEDVPDSVKGTIINQLLELEFATKVANLVDEYDQGEEIEIVEAVSDLVARTKTSMERVCESSYADFDEADVSEDGDDSGLKWPLPVMNEHYRNILGGDQYIVAARPGKGKTSLLTFINWGIAKQLPEDKVIVWFNNESRRQRIMSRQIMSALGKSNQELAQLKAAGTLREEYVKEMGSADRVKIYDIHGKSTYHLESILESIGLDNVGAIIVDMLDNVRSTGSTDLREDQRLERLYQWSRELGVQYDAPVFVTSQISNEGAGLLFPTENMLKDSKTGKQGACDGIIMLGASDDPLQARFRGLSMPKEKCKREGASDMREEVRFDEDRGRFF